MDLEVVSAVWALRLTPPATVMSPFLPPEILDVIVDNLEDDPDALKSCCRVSKSWVPRTRKHLFADVLFESTGTTIETWMKAFPDPSNSPAHYTRSLWVFSLKAVTTSVCACILSFCRVESLWFNGIGWGGTGGISLAQLRGLSPNLKTLQLCQVFAPIAEIFDLICSFPLLNDLTLVGVQSLGTNVDGWILPATSPKLRGSLRLFGESRSVVRELLNFPVGLHFSEILVSGPVEFMDLRTTMNLLSKCSDTIESFLVAFLPAATSRAPPPINISVTTKLKHLRLECNKQDVRWIVETLQTANYETLRRITILFHSVPLAPTERVLSEWHELDRLLVQLWTSYSIVPEITYKTDPGKGAPDLLPELTKRGAFLRGK